MRIEPLTNSKAPAIVGRLVFKEEEGRVLRADISPSKSSTTTASRRKKSVLIGGYVIPDEDIPHANCVQSRLAVLNALERRLASDRIVAHRIVNFVPCHICAHKNILLKVR